MTTPLSENTPLGLVDAFFTQADVAGHVSDLPPPLENWVIFL